jgi:hypothetical protein
VFGGLNRLLVPAFVVGAFLVAPSGALADCGGGPSAEHVYSECVPNGGGGAPSGGAPSGGAHSGSTTAPISSPAAHALKQAGKDRRVLASLMKGYGIQRHLATPETSSSGTSPSALGSAFSLGSGPTLLLIVLAGTAFVILTGSGMRLWRRSHRS